MATTFQKRLALLAGLVALAVALLAVSATTAQARPTLQQVVAHQPLFAAVVSDSGVVVPITGAVAPFVGGSQVAAARIHQRLLEHQYLVPAAATTINGPIYLRPVRLDRLLRLGPAGPSANA